MQRSISMAALELATTRHYGSTYIYTYISMMFPTDRRGSWLRALRAFLSLFTRNVTLAREQFRILVKD